MPSVNWETGANHNEKKRPDFPEAYSKHEANSGSPKPSKYGLNFYFPSVISKNPSADNEQGRPGRPRKVVVWIKNRPKKITVIF